MNTLAFLLAFLVCVLSQPINYVIIFVDDLGYNDTNLGKAPFIRSNVNTPNLKQMTEEGVLFDQFYTGASLCTPSRAALLMGQFPGKFNFFGVNRVYISPGQTTGLPDNMTTIASYFKGCANYTTGMTGKWHLGHSQAVHDDTHWLPLQKGFDVAELISVIGNGPGCMAGNVPPCSRQILPNGTAIDFFPFQSLTTYDPPSVNPLRGPIPWNCTYGVQIPIGGSYGPNPQKNAGWCSLYRGNQLVQQPWEYANITQRLTAEALKFFDARGQDQKPFFYFFSHIAVHEPYYAAPAFHGKSQMGPYGDMIEEMDWSVGQVLNRLNQSDIGPTVVYWLSDNGAFLEKNAHLPQNPNYQTSSGGLRGGKGQHYEGGVRTPAIVWGNAKYSQVRPNFQRNVSTHAIGHTVDIFKTIATMQNCPVPAQALSGLDLTPLLEGTTPTTSWGQASGPFTPVPYFCENNVVGLRWTDAGNGTLPARDLKILFALPTWTQTATQTCRNNNPYSSVTCNCNNLQALQSPTTTTNISLWFQLFDLTTNPGENPAQNLLFNSAIRTYYLTKIGAIVLPYLATFKANFDSNPLSASGIYDFRSSLNLGATALLPCPANADPVTCTVNSETGATQVTVTSSTNPAYFGEQITFQANVALVADSSPITDGTIFFRVNSYIYRESLGDPVSLTSSGASLATTLPVNPYTSITAEYSGQVDTYLASINSEYIQVVNPATTALTLSTSTPAISTSSSEIDIEVNQPITIHADLGFIRGSGPLDGTITFSQDAVVVSTVPVSGNGQYTYTTAPITSLHAFVFSAVYTPTTTTNFVGSTSNSLTIRTQATTSLALSSAELEVLVNQPLDVIADLQFIQGTGDLVGSIAMSVNEGALTPVTVTGTGEYTFTFTPTTLDDYNFTAVYTPSDPNFAGSTSASLTIRSKANTAVVLSKSPAGAVVVGQPFNLTATVTATGDAPVGTVPTGFVQYDPYGLVVQLVNGIAVLPVIEPAVDQKTLSVTFLPDPDFYFTTPSNELELVINQANTTMTLVNTGGNGNGQTRTFVATVSAVLPSLAIPQGVVSWTEPNRVTAINSGTGVATLTVDKFKGNSLTAVYPGNLNFRGCSAHIQVNIN